jgi:hypothetical protein
MTNDPLSIIDLSQKTGPAQGSDGPGDKAGRGIGSAQGGGI